MKTDSFRVVCIARGGVRVRKRYDKDNNSRSAFQEFKTTYKNTMKILPHKSGIGFICIRINLSIWIGKDRFKSTLQIQEFIVINLIAQIYFLAG